MWCKLFYSPLGRVGAPLLIFLVSSVVSHLFWQLWYFLHPFVSSLIVYIFCVPIGIVGMFSFAFLFPLSFTGQTRQVNGLFYSWCRMSSNSSYYLLSLKSILVLNIHLLSCVRKLISDEAKSETLKSSFF